MSDEREIQVERQVIDEPPPVLGTWPRVYLFVLCELAVVIGLFAIFTAYFKPNA